MDKGRTALCREGQQELRGFNCRCGQVLLKVTTPLDWGLSGGSSAPDRGAIKQECWHPGDDRFAQVRAAYSPPAPYFARQAAHVEQRCRAAACHQGVELASHSPCTQMPCGILTVQSRVRLDSLKPQYPFCRSPSLCRGRMQQQRTTAGC